MFTMATRVQLQYWRWRQFPHSCIYCQLLSLALLSCSENKWTSAQWWLCLSAYERVSFRIPSACPTSCEMLKCIPTHGLVVCVHIRVSVLHNRDVMDKMNDTRSRWNFHFVSFLFAAHLFIHSVIRSKHCTQSMLIVISSRSLSPRRSIFTSGREFNARYFVKPQKTLAKVKKMR